MEPEPPGAAFFCLEPEPTQVGRSWSRLRDLGHLEPEVPKKVAAPQHCWYRYTHKTSLSEGFLTAGSEAYANEIQIFTGADDKVQKAEKAGRTFKRAFMEYSSRLFTLKEAQQQILPQD